MLIVMPYAITKTSDAEEKQAFYEQLNGSAAHKGIPKDDMMDYLNGKVCSNNTHVG